MNLETDQTSCGALIYPAVRWEVLHSTPQRFFTAFKLTDGRVTQHTTPHQHFGPQCSNLGLTLGSILNLLSATCKACFCMRNQGALGSSREGTQRSKSVARYSLTRCLDTSRVFASGTWEVSQGPQLKYSTCDFPSWEQPRWGVNYRNCRHSPQQKP